MRRTFLFLFLALGAATAFGADQDLYNPLEVGLRWEVDVEVTPLGGTPSKGTALREVTATQTVNGRIYFVVLTTFKNLPRMHDYTMYRRKTPHGIYAFSSLDKDKHEFLETPIPLTVGQSWKTIIFDSVVESTAESNESVTVDGKTYDNCIKITFKSDRGATGTFYQAPDVGNVLETTTADRLTYKFTLKSFSGLK
jgi:hypothetical protein